MNVVLDACAGIAFFKAESGAEVVGDYLMDSNSQCFIHAINACEIYYDFYRDQGQSVAAGIIQELVALGVLIRSDLSQEFWQMVGGYKATIRRISLADCFALALTHSLKGTLLTSDHTEFEPVVDLSICEIQFIR